MATTTRRSAISQTAVPILIATGLDRERLDGAIDEICHVEHVTAFDPSRDRLNADLREFHPRQYVNPHGQQWTTHQQLKRWHRNTVHTQGAGVTGIGVDPQVGIGQRALLVRGAEGSVLWDCVPLLDDGLAEFIRALGGLRAIAVSHPHFHTSMVDWAHAFGCPVYIHADNRDWVMRPDACIHFWDGETMRIARDMTVIRCGGHFPGSSVMHHDHDGGALFTGDTFYVNPDRQSIAMMHSFPNYIPLSAATVRRVAGAVESFEFRKIYGQWWDAVIPEDGKNVIRRSAERYSAAIEDRYGSQFTANPHHRD